MEENTDQKRNDIISITMPVGVKDQMRLAARRHGLSMSAFVRQLFFAYLAYVEEQDQGRLF